MTTRTTTKDDAGQQLPIAVRAKEGARVLGVGLSTFWRYAATDPSFPPGRKLSPRTTTFVTSELLVWRDSKARSQPKKILA